MENSFSTSRKTSLSSSDGKKEPNLTGQSSETASESQKSTRTRFWESEEWVEISRKYQEAQEEYGKRMQKWWTTLPPEQQQWAFYNVCRLIYKGDVEERQSYRGVLYDVFGWGPEAYALGMEARYMELHNLLWDAHEYAELQAENAKLNQINQELYDAAEYDRCQDRVGALDCENDGACRV